MIKCPAEMIAFVQNDEPTQAGLKAIEHQELKQSLIVVKGHAPLFIVILGIQSRFSPTAARHRKMLAQGICASNPCSAQGKKMFSSVGVVGVVGVFQVASGFGGGYAGQPK